MNAVPKDVNLGKVCELAEEYGLELVVLFGSRARGEARRQSDWDFAYLPCSAAELSLEKDLELAARFAEAVGSDNVDAVRLDHAPPTLRKEVADSAIVLFERQRGAFERFWLLSLKLYWDAAKMREMRRQALDDWLKRLGLNYGQRSSR